jgi:uncharacterized protein (TIGR03000 family)
MYSVVLMMALTTGGDSAALGRHGCCGQSACCGQASSCCGSRGHGHRSGCCGASSCSTCGSYSGCGSSSGCGVSTGCSTCGHASAGFCTSGTCGLALADTGSALIVVSLPADAKLTIDGEATTSTSDKRVFVSNNLPTGQEFHYTLKAEVMVDGKSVEVSKVVTVRAGEETNVTLAAPTAVAAR